jgi:phospholipid/cholesterol/gamma-HCH transport system substrate-binding protein
MSREFRLGIFIVATLLILAAGIFLIGNKQFVFTPTYRLKAYFQNVAGLSGGAEVRVGGIHEGTVRRIELPSRPDGKVTVVMDLVNSTRDIIKKDSVASIKTEGLVGDKYVEISFGSKDAAKVENGDAIGSELPLEISDLIKKTQHILDKVDTTTDNLESISSKINQGKGTVGALINDKTMYQQANAATAQAKAGATAFQENMEALKHNLLLRGFFKKRGYEDSSELIKYEISRLPTQGYIREFVYDAQRMFDKSDSAKLRNQKALNEAGKFLEANKFGLAVVVAYTRMQGDTDKDRVLAQARAMIVRRYLVQNFRLDDTRIKTMGVGKTEQAGDSNKVRILIYPLGSTVSPGQKQSSGGQ